MTPDEAHQAYTNHLYAHTWVFKPYTFPTRATDRRDDLLTDARDTLATIRDLGSAP